MALRITSFQSYIEQLHEQFSADRSGAVADYIPELSRVDPDDFGIALVTVDGHVYQAGDSRQPFSIQSISKAFTYGIALEDNGEAVVSRKIDVEPSGEAFNSISLEPDTGRPRNPMINAGAIVSTSLVKGKGSDEKLERILQKFSGYTGRPLEVDQAVYQSERSTGHRNRAIAHLLRNYEILEGDPEQPLDAYFRQCSILVTARDLAQMGACLANDGVNPITGVRALEAARVPRVLSVMATCGMYDYSGNWIFQVGMPAKSGVGGGVVAVLPGQFGVAVYSPRLDAKGNSCRGIAVCEALSRDFGMHMLRVTRTTTTSVIRSSYNAAETRSKLSRDAVSEEYLNREGHGIRVFELTGELMFVSAEIVVQEATEQGGGCDYLVFDLARVSAVDQSAFMLLSEFAEAQIARGKTVLFTGVDRHFSFRQSVGSHFAGKEKKPVFEHVDIDRALEFAENGLLEQAAITVCPRRTVPLADHPMCAGLDDTGLEFLRDLLKPEEYGPGEFICREGERADKVYFLERGRVSVSLRLDNQHDRRLGAFSAGWVFGEAAFFDGRIRTADILADTPVSLLSLDPRSLEQSRDARARGVRHGLMANLAEINLGRLGRANNDIRVLTR